MATSGATVSGQLWTPSASYQGYWDSRLHLYASNSPNSPSWNLIQTVTPSGPGSQVINATYTVPFSVSNLVVRAVYAQSTSAAAPCKAGNDSDMDDLMIAVQ
ncbi:hypothetical protein [Hyalangium gracile]|uniref:hypothetical protein n=1 Tax=Hyalangium gracile TaxID=394092 RepID=UPI001CCD900F|nr:hypothetical protein [Hyalangium gracile]